MQSIGIYYFSGTGNTEIVAELLQASLQNQGHTARLLRIEDILKQKNELDTSQYDILGIGCPIYGFDLPQIVYRFIQALPTAKGQKTFCFQTASDFVELNRVASYTARKELGQKGYDVFYQRIICMSPNWTLKYDERLIRQLYNAAVHKTQRMAGDILSDRERLPKSNILSRGLAKISSWGERWGARTFVRDLYASDACTHCNMCVQNCPVENITWDGDRLVFGPDCLWCMRCVYRCPTQAISARLYKFVIVRGGFDPRQVIDNPDIEQEYVTEKTRGYFGRFRRYFQDIDF